MPEPADRALFTLRLIGVLGYMGEGASAGRGQTIADDNARR